jgi:hypothetical protein
MMRQLEGTTETLRRRPANTAGPTTNVADTLHRLAERFKRRCLIVLISDLYDDPEAVMRALHHFRYRHHEVILFHVLDEAELEFPFTDTVRFVDMETGERIQVDPRYAKEEYQRQIQAFVDGYRRSCSDCQIDYVLTHTFVPYDTMLSRYLHHRSSL